MPSVGARRAARSPSQAYRFFESVSVRAEKCDTCGVESQAIPLLRLGVASHWGSLASAERNAHYENRIRSSLASLSHWHFSSLVGVVVIAGKLTYGNSVAIPAIAKTKNMRRYRKDSWLTS